MSEAQTPKKKPSKQTSPKLPHEDVPVEDKYDGPDPEDDPKGNRQTRIKEPKRPESFHQTRQSDQHVQQNGKNNRGSEGKQ